MVGIEYVDYEIPSERVSAEAFQPADSALGSKSKERFRAFLRFGGVEEVFVQEPCSHLESGERLVERAFASGRLDPGRVRFLVYSAGSHVYDDEKCVPYYLIDKFGLTRAHPVLLFQECSSVLQAMNLATYLTGGDDSSSVMVLAQSCVEHGTSRFTGSSLIGDGSGLMLLGRRSPIATILDTNMTNEVRLGSTHSPDREVSGLVETILSLLDRCDVEIDQLSAVIPLNLHKLYGRLLGKLLGTAPGQIFSENFLEGGHLLDVDPMRNLSDYLKRRCADSGYFVLCASSMVNNRPSATNWWAALCHREDVSTRT